MIGVLLMATSSVWGEVRTQTIQYPHQDISLQGFLAYDDAVEGKRPGVLVVHEWWGLNDYARRRATQLASLGYIALAIDMYGDGKTTNSAEQAGHWSGAFRGSSLMRDRAQAGLALLIKQEQVDPHRVAAIGYCFGGTTVLQLAYSGADLQGVVSFHSSLPSPDPHDMQPGRIKAAILACHGAKDTFVSPERIADFKAKLSATDADWTMITYGEAQHSFTNPGASARNIRGLAYDADADRRSWRHMKQCFDEWFQ